MAITATPLWMEGLATHSAQDYRKMLEGLFNYKAGIFKSTDFAVTTNNNMTVTVAAGMAIVDGTEDANQGNYFVHADSSTIVSVDAAHATLGRLDFVVIRIRDDFYATGPTEGVDLFVVKGTPASSPAEPTVPDNCFVLARLNIAAADATIASGDIVDRRTITSNQGIVSAKGASRQVTSASRPTANLNAYQDFIIESDTGRLYWYDGSTWRPYGAGLIASVASYTLTSSYASTLATFALPAGNWFITAKCEYANQTGATSNYFIQLYDLTAASSLEETEGFFNHTGPFRFHLITMASLVSTTTKTIQLRAKDSGAPGNSATLAKIKLWAHAVSAIA